MPEGAEQNKTTRPVSTSSAPNIAAQSAFASSPDPDDHLPIKKLRVQNPQGSVSHTQISIQIPKPIPSPVNTQPPLNVNTPPVVNLQPTIPPKQIPIVDLDSNEE